ncbi:hypothetical protein [uncultured Sphingomonas sp.]|uniref:hypothetical protein n=1 Tax=uncultured Sphingomonas sp. TaxID=158754 RepID=UPI00258EC3A9|nr:hypothetical protein [uncultured Sphingomonas sp.]
MSLIPLGPVVSAPAPPIPAPARHAGQSVTLDPLSAGHVEDLWSAAGQADASWAYLSYGPFATRNDLAAHVARIAGRDDQPFFAVIPASSGKAGGGHRFATSRPAMLRSRSAAYGFRRACNAPVPRPRRSS